MLPTFLLNTIDINKTTSFSSLNINPKGYKPSDTPFASLKRAIEWSITHGEDVIYCVCHDRGVTELDLDALEVAIHDIVPEGIYALYVHAKFQESVPVSEHCQAIFNIEDVYSFILTRPIFQLTLSLIEQRDNEHREMRFMDFLAVITPHFFSFLDANSKASLLNFDIHVISAFRNVKSYIQECLDSVKKQRYTRYHIYFIDDASTDNSCSKVPDDQFISLKINKTRRYALRNIMHILLHTSISENDIICLLDADDKLAHKYVFTMLNKLYQDNSLLLTYGSMRFIDEFGNIGSAYSKEEFNNIRNSPWRAAHLRTFRYKLFKEFIKQDPNLKLLRDSQGQIFNIPYDMALLFPLMELSGYESTKFIPTVMYDYRRHDNNDQVIHAYEQLKGEMEVRNKIGLSKSF